MSKLVISRGMTLLLVCCWTGGAVTADEAQNARQGQVQFEPADDEHGLPARFQLSAHAFAFERRPIETCSTRFTISEVTFPSPVHTPHPNNNTVHCEYFRPVGTARCPGVVVLHILGGDFDLARLFSRYLADHGVAALFLKMPYYGPRRQPGVSARMVSRDIRQTVAGMTQAVLDIRQAAAWLASQEDIDPKRLGIFGISLGGITAALASSVEPRFQQVCLMLAGGDIAQVAWTSPELAPLRNAWVADGGTKETFFAELKQVDPVSYADRLKGRKMLMINAARDEVIPKACSESLWRVCGRPEIVWLDAGHYSAARFMLDGLSRVTKFFTMP
jgi:dienelactone hydrolase